MEYVKTFNAELAGLYECKPPISKAKMTAITKSGIRAIKFYKHVVQSVEKFIQKCKTEYKVPGLYVIDSLVRQSRHQFSIEKDVFAPRFAKNITVTFYYLFKCPQEEKSKVIRVLNLWQKNHIFSEEIVQPLFDLADPNHPIQKEIANLIAQKANKAKAPPPQPPPPQQQQQFTPQPQLTPQQPHTPQQSTPQQNIMHQVPSGQVANSAATTPGGITLVSTAGQESTPMTAVTNLDPALIQQIQQILMKTTSEEGPVASAVAALGLPQATVPQIPPFSQNMSIAPPVSVVSQQMLMSSSTSILPPMMTSQEIKTPALLPRLSSTGDYDGRTLPFLPVDTSQPPPSFNLPGVFQHMGHNMNQPPPTVIAPPPHHHPIAPQSHHPIPPQSHPLPPQSHPIPPQSHPIAPQPEFNQGIPPPEVPQVHSPKEEGEHSDGSEENKENQDDAKNERRRRSRSRSRSRSKKRRRSRSRSRSRHRRSRSRSRRSRSRDRRSRREKDRDRERDRERQRERDRERKKKGLPPIKKDCLSVCSTTLWVGHLSKLIHQEELSDTFGEYGDIVSIDLIPPRGCAFICMNRRQDAARALSKLKHHKMHNKAITLAWAPGKGVKGKEFKDYWEVDRGCSYIPYKKLSKLSNVDLDAFEDGGVIDEETVPSWLKGRYGSESNKPPPEPVVPVVTGPAHLGPPHPHMVNMVIPHHREHPHRLDIEKGDRPEPHVLPPHMVPHFGVPGISPHPGGLRMISPNMPPPIRMPPHLGVRPLAIPPGSGLIGQPRLGVPPMEPVSSVVGQPRPQLTTVVNNEMASSSEADNMDIEMEDAEKAEQASDHGNAAGRGEAIGLTEQLANATKAEKGLDESMGLTEHLANATKVDQISPMKESAPVPAHPERPSISDNIDQLRDAERTNREFQMREGFAPLRAPMQRPPFGVLPQQRHIGIIPREGQGFDPRTFGHPRPVLGGPPGMIPNRRELHPEMMRAPGLLRPPRPMEIRPGMNELLSSGVPFQGGPQRMNHPGPVAGHRFGLLRAPQPYPPRFGLIGNPRPMVHSQQLLTPPTEERIPGDWIGQSRGQPQLIAPGPHIVERPTEDTWKNGPEQPFPKEDGHRMNPNMDKGGPEDMLARDQSRDRNNEWERRRDWDRDMGWERGRPREWGEDQWRGGREREWAEPDRFRYQPEPDPYNRPDERAVNRPRERPSRWLPENPPAVKETPETPAVEESQQESNRSTPLLDESAMNWSNWTMFASADGEAAKTSAPKDSKRTPVPSKQDKMPVQVANPEKEVQDKVVHTIEGGTISDSNSDVVEINEGDDPMIVEEKKVDQEPKTDADHQGNWSTKPTVTTNGSEASKGFSYNVQEDDHGSQNSKSGFKYPSENVDYFSDDLDNYDESKGFVIESNDSYPLPLQKDVKESCQAPLDPKDDSFGQVSEGQDSSFSQAESPGTSHLESNESDVNKIQIDQPIDQGHLESNESDMNKMQIDQPIDQGIADVSQEHNENSIQDLNQGSEVNEVPSQDTSEGFSEDQKQGSSQENDGDNSPSLMQGPLEGNYEVSLKESSQEKYEVPSQDTPEVVSENINQRSFQEQSFEVPFQVHCDESLDDIKQDSFLDNYEVPSRGTSKGVSQGSSLGNNEESAQELRQGSQDNCEGSAMSMQEDMSNGTIDQDMNENYAKTLDPPVQTDLYTETNNEESDHIMNEEKHMSLAEPHDQMPQIEESTKSIAMDDSGEIRTESVDTVEQPTDASEDIGIST